MPKKLPTRAEMGHAPYPSSEGPRCRACFGAWPCEVDRLQVRARELEAGLAHAEYVAQEIRTIAEDDRPSRVDDGRDRVLPATQRLREIAELVEAEILGGPSPFRAARAVPAEDRPGGAGEGEEMARFTPAEIRAAHDPDACAEKVCYVRDLLERVATLEAGLRKYGQHGPECWYLPRAAIEGGDTEPCSCGLADLVGPAEDRPGGAGERG